MLDFLHHLILVNHYDLTDGQFIGNIFIGSAIEFAQVSVIRSIEVLFDIHEIYHIAISEILVWTVNTGEGLEQVVSIERTAEIQFLQSWCIKAREQHLVDNQDIHIHQFLEAVDIFFPFHLVTFIVKDKRSCQWLIAVGCHHRLCSHHHLFFMVQGHFFRMVESFLPKAIKFTCLWIGLANNHGAYGIIGLFCSEASEVSNDII